VWRLEHGKWTPLISTSHSNAIRTGANATNTLTVVTQGDYASFYIYGAKVGSIHNTQRKGPFVGVITETSALERAPVTWRYGFWAWR